MVGDAQVVARVIGRVGTRPRGDWASRHLRRVVAVDCAAPVVAGGIALLTALHRRFVANELRCVLVLTLVTVLWVVGIALTRSYTSRLIGLGSEEFRRVLAVGSTLIAASTVLSYGIGVPIVRRCVVVVLPVTIALDLLGRWGLRWYLHRQRRRGMCTDRVVAAGHEQAVADLIHRLRREDDHGLEVVAVCLPNQTASPFPRAVADIPVLGGLEDVGDVVAMVGATAVAVLASPELGGAQLRRLAWRLEHSHAELVVAPGLVDLAGPPAGVSLVDGLPLLHVAHPELSGPHRIVKEVLDRLVALVALAGLLPVILVIAVAIRFTSPGPALFRQRRVGKNGREFTMYKFRTMCADAEARKTALAEANEHDGVLFKLRLDPRVTQIGRSLRRWSLDELPQFVNVVLGQMSLVGPRPPLPEEVARYGDDVRRRLVVKPGLTGLWQIGGRSALSWEESVRLDLRYVDSWSLTLDLVILARTLRAVISGDGAY